MVVKEILDDHFRRLAEAAPKVHKLPAWSSWHEIFAMAEREVGRDKVGIERTQGGRVVVTIKPKDFAESGASDATLERSRGDDGSVTIVVTPRDAAPEPTTPAED
jgi:hypothetical protein